MAANGYYIEELCEAFADAEETLFFFQNYETHLSEFLCNYQKELLLTHFEKELVYEISCILTTVRILHSDLSVYEKETVLMSVLGGYGLGYD